MLVKDIMTARPTVVTRDQTVTDAAAVLKSRDVGMIPVVHGLANRELVGVITDRDIVTRHVALGHHYACAVGIHMTSDVEVCRPNDDVTTAIMTMKRAKVRRLPVVDGNDHVVGVLAQADIARDVGPNDPEQLEELLQAISEPEEIPVAEAPVDVLPHAV